ncbi:MAG: translocation/assembly module TamB domain-containing protein, partial [Myxococcota bacterium]
RGGLEGDVHLITAADEGDRLDFHGRIVLRNVEYGPLTADWLAIEGFARGDAERPEARLDVDGRGVAMAGYPLGRADLKLRGGPRNYETIGRFSAPGDRRLEFDARIQASREQYVLDADHIVFAVGDRVWRGTSERVVIRPDRDVAIEHLVLASGSERLEVEGVYRFDGPEHFEAQLQNFDLTGLRALFDDQAPTVTGHADAHLTVEGDLTEPDLLVEGALRGASYHGVDDVDLVYVLTYGEGQLALDAQADLQERGNVAVTSTGYIDPSEPDLAVALEDGVYEVDVAVADLDLQLLRSALGEDAVPPVSGHLVGRMTASGPIQAPSFESSLHVPELGLPNWPELGVRSNVSYRDGALNGHIVTEDDHGELAEVEGNLLIDLVHLIEHPEDLAASLEVVPWRVSVRLPTRTLGTLPQSLRKSVPEGLEPLEVAMSATLSGGGFQTRGDLTAHLGWDEDFSLRPCGAEAHPRATITGSLKDGVTDFELVGQVGREAVAYAEASASTPLDDWLHEGEPPGLPAVAASAQLRQLDLGKVPWVCERFDGPVSGEVEMADLFTDDPRAEANLATNGLIVRRFQDRSLQGAWTLAFETAPFEGALELSADHEHLEGTTGLSWWNGGEAQVLAHLPLIWNADHPVPEVEGDSPLQLEADLDDVPLALVLSVIPNLVDVEGTVSGRLATSGQLDDPALRGELAIRNGYFQLMPMGQQVRNVEGDLVFHGDWVELRQLVAQEREGELKIRGAVQLDGIRPSSGQLALEADTFPVRSEGAVLAKVTGEASVDAEMDPDRSTAHVTLRDLSLALPDEGLRSIQGLEPHPDVQVQGNTEPREQTEEDPYPIVIGIDSANPFWVRRSDFSALVSMDLGVTYLDPDLYVDGSVKIGRGFFEVFGKRFDVEQASLDFDGASEINPEVNLQAVHKLRSGGADTVNVTVTGRLARPRVEFATTVVGCQERGQVIALLITGRCARSGGNEGQGFEQAGQQAASFLAGVAYGVLTLSAREQLGDKFPMIVIESGTGGRPVVRAGIDASEIIPKPLQSIVQSAYVEGFFTASREEDQARTSAQGGQDNGFLLELQFPRNIVGTGVFSPPDNWSVDFTWEP